MKVLLTAGPTREAIDPVRFLSNRSSGRMGFALAAAAAERYGDDVCLVSGPVSLATPPGVRRVDVTSAQEMYEAVVANLDGVVLAIHSAAVADYRPKVVHSQKYKKGADEWEIVLERTQDILGSMRDPLGFQGCLVGFAAETENLVANAQKKLEKKGCDLVIANDVSRADIGFDRRENEVTLLYRERPTEGLPKTSKEALAKLLLDRIDDLLTQTVSPS